MGIYSYKRDNKVKVNLIFLIICITASLWAIGYAFMLVSPNIEIANMWRIFSALGWCFLSSLWLFFIFSLKDKNQKKANIEIQYLLYLASTIFFISNLIYEPSKLVSNEVYGFVDNLYTATSVGTVFSIYNVVLFRNYINIYWNGWNLVRN
jgi:hypothetical protein